VERPDAGGEDPLPARLVHRASAALEHGHVEAARGSGRGEGEAGGAAAHHEGVVDAGH
jgi:hypothetical protein